MVKFMETEVYVLPNLRNTTSSKWHGVIVKVSSWHLWSGYGTWPKLSEHTQVTLSWVCLFNSLRWRVSVSSSSPVIFGFWLPVDKSFRQVPSTSEKTYTECNTTSTLWDFCKERPKMWGLMEYVTRFNKTPMSLSRTREGRWRGIESYNVGVV